MTIVTAIKCTNGIAVACDSRTTLPSGHIKDDVKKLHVVRSKDGHSWLVAEAGNIDLAGRAVELIMRKAGQLEAKEYRSFADCVESAISELKDLIREQFKGTAEELQRHFESHEFSLLVAYYFNGSPLIFSVDFPLGVLRKIDSKSHSIGCGWVLADFIVSRLNLEEFDVTHGIWTVTYAVEEVKKFDGRCGGQTRIGHIQWKDERSYAALAHGKGLTETVAEAENFSVEAKANWRKVADDRIKAVIKRRPKP